MAYHLHHNIQFFNCLNEKIVVELYRKEVIPDSVTPLLANSFSVSYPTGNSDKFDPIISCEAKLNFTLYSDDTQEFDDFIVSFDDEWKMIAYDDSQVVFVGFLTPGEGRAEFQDKPYDVTLTAVDGLGLLKGVPLTKGDGSKFTNVSLIITYVLAILNKTGLGLNLQLFSNIVEESMQDRTQNNQADTFNQTGLHARTFQKNATEFTDCYTTLERILAEYFCIYQWFGKWVIVRIGELQENVGAKIWHTEYNSAGAVVNVGQNLYNPSAVGRDRLIHPVELTQFIGSNFAVKSARYSFNYSIWPEIPTNNKFDRGSIFNVQTIPATPGNPLKYIEKYTISDWEYRINNPFNGTISGDAYRQSTKDEFGTEIHREIVLERQSGGAGHRFLRCEAIPVSVNDKVNISYDFKSSVGGSGNVTHLFVTLETLDGSLPYKLNSAGGAIPADGIGTLIWQRTQALKFLNKFYSSGENPADYTSFSFTTPSFPINGLLYVCFISFDPPVGRVVAYKNFSLEYYPFIAGSLAQIKADYAETSQNDNYKDVIDEQVFISDTTKKVLQGSLYRENLIDLTTPTWHRFNNNERRNFKELGELARFNANYRRMWKMEGQYDGLKFTPAENQTIIEPLSFHRHFSFPDSAKLAGHYFVLVPPLTINYSEGRADMNFAEVLQDGSQDGNYLGNNHIPLEYIFG
jgi:hypothetical protein